MSNDRRRDGDRDPCKIEAAISVGDHEAHIPCLIEDISSTGAKLRFRAETKLPATFCLLMPLFKNYVEERTSELRWRVGSAAGVRFTSESGRPGTLGTV